MKLKLILSQLLIIFVIANSSAQPERYLDSLFNINIISDITYGSNYDLYGNFQSLEMDIYIPVDDPLPERPLIILAHGGSFIYGSKLNPSMVELCTRFASMGYVTASIEYRLGIDVFSFDPEKEFTYAILRATHDMRAAVRFFRKDASTLNDYKIDSNLIFAGGSSAGAFTALHLAYLDQLSEVPEVITDIGELGGIPGNSGNPGYSDQVMGVVNLCGAIGDTSWMEMGDEALVSMHGDNDQTVPYGTAVINLFGFDIAEVDGSASISERADDLDLNYAFHTFWGQDHVPYDPLWGGGPDQPAYMDTTVHFVKYFLYEIVTNPVTSFSETAFEGEEVVFQLYPNPVGADGVVYCRILMGNGQSAMGNQHSAIGNPLSIGIFDVLGNRILTLTPESYSQGENIVPIKVSGLASGIYFIELLTGTTRETAKFVVNR